MAAIEDYHGKPSLKTATLTALLAGDVSAAQEGLNRMTFVELVQLAENCGQLARMAADQVNGCPDR